MRWEREGTTAGGPSLSWGVRRAPRAQTEDCPYARVMAEPMGPMRRLEPCDGRVWMRPSDCFLFSQRNEKQDHLLAMRKGEDVLEVGGGRRCKIYSPFGQFKSN